MAPSTPRCHSPRCPHGATRARLDRCPSSRTTGIDRHRIPADTGSADHGSADHGRADTCSAATYKATCSDWASWPGRVDSVRIRRRTTLVPAHRAFVQNPGVRILTDDAELHAALVRMSLAASCSAASRPVFTTDVAPVSVSASKEPRPVPSCLSVDAGDVGVTAGPPAVSASPDDPSALRAAAGTRTMSGYGPRSSPGCSVLSTVDTDHEFGSCDPNSCAHVR